MANLRDANNAKIQLIYKLNRAVGSAWNAREANRRFAKYSFQQHHGARGAGRGKCHGIAGSVTGLREMPVADIVFNNVHIASEKGFTCRNCRGIAFYDVENNPQEGPAMILDGAADIDTARLRGRTLAGGASLVQTNH